MDVNIMVATSAGNRGVGYKGRLSWPFLKEDVDHYHGMIKRRVNEEKKNVLIAGRKTWQNISKDKKSDLRFICIVISRTFDPSTDPHQPTVVTSLDEAFSRVSELRPQVETVWILGGEGVWQETIDHPLCKRIYLTRIFHDFQADVFFPAFEDKFVKMSDPLVDGKLKTDEASGVKLQFEVYKRKP